MPVGQLLRIDEAAARLRISRAALYRLVGRGELRVVRIGRSARIAEQDLAAFVEKLRRGSRTEGEPHDTLGSDDEEGGAA